MDATQPPPPPAIGHLPHPQGQAFGQPYLPQRQTLQEKPLPPHMLHFSHPPIPHPSQQPGTSGLPQNYGGEWRMCTVMSVLTFDLWLLMYWLMYDLVP